MRAQGGCWMLGVGCELTDSLRVPGVSDKGQRAVSGGGQAERWGVVGGAGREKTEDGGAAGQYNPINGSV